jgi:type IV secretion system protein VirD4
LCGGFQINNSFNEEYRFGSAAWADKHDIRAAGLLDPRGPQIGFLENKPLYLDGDAPMITVGGAGSGKLRDLLGYVVCNTPGQRMMILDPRGEQGAISWHIHASRGEYAWFWNPMRLCGLPQHACNPLDILDADSPHFHADCKFIAESLIPLSGSSNGQYFELRGREWLESLMKSCVEINGRTSLPDLYRVISIIEADPQTWANQLEKMLASSFEGVRRAAGEMLAKQQDSPKEFGAILGELYAHLSFLDDPTLLPHLEGGDFSLDMLTDPGRSSKIFLNIPAEYLSLWSPLIRLFFTVSILYKSRKPQGPRVMLLVDEAGQLGKFEGLLRAFTYGRGAGVRAWAIFQDAGQIIRNFGAPALQGFLGSAQMRQFFGVRDYQTAQLISDMLGSETLTYDDPLQQEGARHKKRQLIQRMFEGEDPFASVFDYAHYERAARNRTKQARQLMTPDEILAMPEDRQILFISGKNLRPILAQKYPYFMRSEMAGLYLPNPYHPPTDRVQIAARFGTKWAEVVRENVPARWAGFPQFQSGTLSYVKGYYPS